MKKCHCPSLARIPKIQPPSLPQVIQDKTGSLRYQRVSFLGEVAIYLFRPYLVLTYHNIAGRVR